MFIHADLPETFRDLFFGPFEPGETVETFDDHAGMAQIVSRSGLFPSASQASKNGWNKEIPPGFSVVEHRKKKRKIFILNVFPGWNEEN